MTRLVHTLLICLAVLSQNVLASILAIDYGSEWIKASLMAPGQPFDVLLDRSSKRKIQASVGWKRDDRLFGTDAFNLAGRFPTDIFSYLKLVQGVPYDSPMVPYYKSISTAEVVSTSRNTVAVKRPDGTEWSVEELVAMQFGYIRELAENLAGERITDVVVTVPPYYTQHQRASVNAAVEIAGMRSIGLVHDGSAVAVNYAMTRTFPPAGEAPEYHVIYDAGASGIRATVVAFNGLPSSGKKNGKTAAGTSIVVKGVGFDTTTGGVELDRRLRDILATDFTKRYRKDVRTDKRGMAKLWKEAGRLKAILSANAEAMASVESLAFDIDYRAKVTRAEFEAACKDMKVKFTKPIFDALSNAGIGLGNITSVILTGGSTRTPMVQAAVKAAVGESKVAVNVNADEAAVLGAALHGASLSRQFKTKEIKITDVTPYDIQSAYASEIKVQTESGSTKPSRTIHTLLYSAGSNLGKKKTLSLKRKEDLTLKLEYKASPMSGFPTDLYEAEITGVAEALNNLTEAGATDPMVKVNIFLTESGFVTVQDAVVHGEIKDESLTGKLKSLFGAGANSATETDNETIAGSESTESAKSSDQSTGSETEASKQSEAPKKKNPPKDTIPLEITVKSPVSLGMNPSEKRIARDRVITVDKDEMAKRAKEEARNTLEGYLYRLRDLLEEEGDTPFRKCSKAPERKAMQEKLEKTFSWLHEHGDDATTKDYISHRTELEKLEQPVIHRYTEIQEFPKALNNSQMWNWSSRLFITDAKLALEKEEQGGDPAKWSKEEIAELEKTLIEHEKWLNEMVEKQKAVPIYDDPAVESSELRTRAKVLENHLQRLAKKKVPRRKTTSTLSATNSSTSATQTASSTSTTGSTQQEKGSSATGHHDEL